MIPASQPVQFPALSLLCSLLLLLTGPILDIALAELPTLFTTKLPNGITRIVLITCVPKTGELRWMDSDDQGLTWSPLEKQKLKENRGIIVALASMWRVHEQSGKPTSTWRGIFHDYNFDNFTIDLTFKRVGNEWKTTFAKDESPPFFSLRSLQRRPKALWLIEFA